MVEVGKCADRLRNLRGTEDQVMDGKINVGSEVKKINSHC